MSKVDWMMQSLLTSIRLVVNPEKMVISEARRTFTKRIVALPKVLLGRRVEAARLADGILTIHFGLNEVS